MLHNTAIFIFRRDFRLYDNTGLIQALKESESVIPLFIFTPAQISGQNKYKSSNAIQFMIASLYDLNEQIKKANPKCQLWTFYGAELDVLKKILKKIAIDAIYVNADYTPYSIKRDTDISAFCHSHDIAFHSHTDVLLLDTNDFAAKNGNRYHNFTIFYKNALKQTIRKPKSNTYTNYKPLLADFRQWKLHILDKIFLNKNYYEINQNIAIQGGRTHALAILRKIDSFKNYKHMRNLPEYPTTKLSAYNKFGTISVREAYYAFTKEKTGELCKGLYWRDFYYYVGVWFKQFYRYDHIPHGVSNKNIVWENSTKWYKLWKNGQTGVPFVDAAMREMNTTGFMHNRGRLIVSQFLVKDLLIDWKYGERYFSTRLVDIDRAQNVGNWNWSSSYGLDNTPFLRIFNPWTQSKTYDPECIYIKRWIPELQDVENKHIHRWDKYHTLYKIDYPEPIVDHAVQRTKFIKFYKKYVS